MAWTGAATTRGKGHRRMIRRFCARPAEDRPGAMCKHRKMDHGVLMPDGVLASHTYYSSRPACRRGRGGHSSCATHRRARAAARRKTRAQVVPHESCATAKTRRSNHERGNRPDVCGATAGRSAKNDGAPRGVTRPRRERTHEYGLFSAAAPSGTPRTAHFSLVCLMRSLVFGRSCFLFFVF